MSNDDQTIRIVYNGEVYNFAQLRMELEGKGYRFRSRTDTEVVLRAYEAWGTGCLQRFNGIFAFAIWDSREHRLFLARDRFGVKPLYYLLQGKRFLFASEIKSLLQSEDVQAEMDLEALNAYLTFRYVPGSRTLFKGIRSLPPASYALFCDGQLEINTYWRMKFDPCSMTVEEQVERARECLRNSVKRQMVSDVSLGVFLSGGLDSSAILAMMTEVASEPIKTYTIGFKREDEALEGQNKDLHYARRIARIFGVDAHERVLEPDVVALLPRVVEHLEEPVGDPAAITSYLISEAARGDVKVLLSGQGGDEVMGGYPWHLAGKIASDYDRLPAAFRMWSERSLTRIPMVKSRYAARTIRRIWKFLENAPLPPRERYIGFCSHISGDDRKAIYSNEIRGEMAGYDPWAIHRSHFEACEGYSFTDQMLYVDLMTFLPYLNLTYTDKTSMAHSIEARVPFLDNEFVDFMAGVPGCLKIKGLTQKYILKKAMEGILPKAVVYRKKAGFGAPIRSWLVKDLAEMVNDLLSENAITARGLFDHQMVRRIVEENRSGSADHNYLIYSLLTLEIWCQTFLDAPRVVRS